MNTTDRALEILEDTVLTLEEEKKGMVQYALQLQQEIASRENQKQFTLEVLEKTKKSEAQLQVDFKKMLDHAIKQSHEIRELKEKLDAKYRKEEPEDYIIQLGDTFYS